MKPYPRNNQSVYYTLVYETKSGNRRRRQGANFDDLVAYAEKRTGVTEWFEFRQYGWSSKDGGVTLGGTSHRVTLSKWFRVFPRKQTNGRRAAIIESLELRPDVTWPEIISTLAIQDETSFQIRLAELRRTQ